MGRGRKSSKDYSCTSPCTFPIFSTHDSVDTIIIAGSDHNFGSLDGNQKSRATADISGPAEPSRLSQFFSSYVHFSVSFPYSNRPEQNV